MSKRFDIHEGKLDSKFNELKSEISNIKSQNFDLDKHINDNLTSFVSNSGNMTTDSGEINNKVSNTDDYKDVLTNLWVMVSISTSLYMVVWHLIPNNTVLTHT